MRKFYLVLLFLMVGLISNAQLVNFNIINIPTGYYGTTNKNNRDFIVDHLDRQWLALQDSGVGMYDGTTWTFFNRQNSGLQNDTVYSLSEDDYNNIWMGSAQGLVKYDGTNWTLYSKANNQLPSDTITCAAHKNGDSWFGTAKGLAFYDGISWIQYTTSNSNLPDDSIQCIDITSIGEVWIGTISGVYRFDGLSFISYGADANSLPATDVRVLLVTVNDAVWISNLSSTYYLNNSGSFSDLDSIFTDTNTPCPASPPNTSSKMLAADSIGNVYLYNYQNVIYQISPLLSIKLCNSITNPNPPCAQLRIQHNILYQAVVNTHFNCIAASIYSKTIRYKSLDSIPFRTLLSLDQNLNINQVSARILNRGDMHWDPIGQTPLYTVPACSGKQPLYASAIWIGGLDQTGNLHTAAMTYCQQGAIDFYPGPLDTITGQADSTSFWNYDRIWKINKITIDEFKINFLNGNVGNGSYPIPESIASWPAAGIGNHSRKLAPYVDYNADGAYNPNDGDYPQIRGDQELWWVFNDTLSPHTETNGPAFGLEIHGEAYAYNCPATSPQSEVINYTTFYRYTLINRSQNMYDSLKIGLWCDFDLGNATDDYIGCDSMQNTFFAYNGDNDDDGAGGYGLNPPMQSITVLNGPSAYINDGLDNNHNGVTDENNETNGLSNFVRYISGNNIPNAIPYLTEHYNYYLNSKWMDESLITYGGDGRGGGNGATNIPTNFMYSGTPYENQVWNMANAGHVPDDVRGVGSSGPFHLGPGESQTIDFAYIYTRDTTGPNGLYTSVAKNHDDVRRIREWFDAGSPDPCTFLSIKENNTPNEKYCIVNPNPSSDRIFLNCKKEHEKINYLIRDLMGRTISSGIYSTSGIDITKLPPQVYLIELNYKNSKYALKFIKSE